MPEFVPIVIGLIVAGVIVLGVFGYLAEKKRREELEALARELGWRFDASKDSSHDTEYANFEIFRRGHSRRAYNTLWGALEIDGRPWPAKMGDFTYKVTSGSGKDRSTTTYNFSYLIVHLPFEAMPSLLIRPEGFFDKVADFFGFGAISFESAEFNRRFHVNSNDRKFAYDVLHPLMMEFLMRANPPAIDIEHSRCCFSDGSTRWTPEQFHGKIRWMREFFDQWPGYLKEQLYSRAVGQRIA